MTAPRAPKSWRGNAKRHPRILLLLTHLSGVCIPDAETSPLPSAQMQPFTPRNSFSENNPRKEILLAALSSEICLLKSRLPSGSSVAHAGAGRHLHVLRRGRGSVLLECINPKPLTTPVAALLLPTIQTNGTRLQARLIKWD